MQIYDCIYQYAVISTSFLPHEPISTSLGRIPGVSGGKKNILGRGNSKCKGPEASIWLPSLGTASRMVFLRGMKSGGRWIRGVVES